MSEPSSPATVLNEALQRISLAKAWCKAHDAENAKRKAVDPKDPTSCRWCLIGAVRSVCPDNHDLLMACYDALDDAVRMSGYRRHFPSDFRISIGFNDDEATSHDMAIGVLHAARDIASAEVRP